MKTAEYLTPAQYALEHRWGYIDAQPPRIRAKDVAWERRELREHTEMVTKTANGKDRHISMLTASGEVVSTEKFRKDMYQTNTCAKMLNVMNNWGVRHSCWSGENARVRRCVVVRRMRRCVVVSSVVLVWC